MLRLANKIRSSIVSKLTILVGLVLLLSISVWAYFNIDYQQKKATEGIIEAADWLSHTIKLGTHYAMMHNLRDDLTRIIKTVAQEKKLENIRIYNKNGEIKYSNKDAELDQMTNIKDEACFVCHRTDPPLAELSLSERTRIITSPQGARFLGIISPIYSEPGCASAACHAHLEFSLVALHVHAESVPATGSAEDALPALHALRAARDQERRPIRGPAKAAGLDLE